MNLNQFTKAQVRAIQKGNELTWVNEIGVLPMRCIRLLKQTIDSAIATCTTIFLEGGKNTIAKRWAPLGENFKRTIWVIVKDWSFVSRDIKLVLFSSIQRGKMYL